MNIKIQAMHPHLVVIEDWLIHHIIIIDACSILVVVYRNNFTYVKGTGAGKGSRLTDRTDGEYIANMKDAAGSDIDNGDTSYDSWHMGKHLS